MLFHLSANSGDPRDEVEDPISPTSHRRTPMLREVESLVLGHPVNVELRSKPRWAWTTSGGWAACT